LNKIVVHLPVGRIKESETDGALEDAIPSQPLLSLQESSAYVA